MTFTYGMQELSVLCVMIALFCVGMGLKKRKPAEPVELPKIKDPVVVPPKAEAPTSAPAPATEEEKPTGDNI